MVHQCQLVVITWWSGNVHGKENRAPSLMHPGGYCCTVPSHEALPSRLSAFDAECDVSRVR